jgi:hypothetical protein
MSSDFLILYIVAGAYTAALAGLTKPKSWSYLSAIFIATSIGSFWPVFFWPVIYDLAKHRSHSLIAASDKLSWLERAFRRRKCVYPKCTKHDRMAKSDAMT